MSRTAPPEDSAPGQSLLSDITELGAVLRTSLAPVVEALAGTPARPTRLSRAIGLDKSLASRLTRALRVSSDAKFMHQVPSPEGLRILGELASGQVDDALLVELRAAADQFERLLDATPGGRAAIDAHISEFSDEVQRAREHTAKQASFKSMSFLLGHFCDTLVTSLFLIPSANGRTIDGIEIHRRIGLQRIRPRTPLALLSVFAPPEDAPPMDSTRFESIMGEESGGPLGMLLPEYCSSPLPRLDVVRNGGLSTLVLKGGVDEPAPDLVTSSFRIRNGWVLDPGPGIHSVRGYLLHVPCKTLVRDVFIREDLLPGAAPQVTFNLPGPKANEIPPTNDGPRHFAAVDLSATLEQLPLGNRRFDIPGVDHQDEIARHVLAMAGHGDERFRGWRCRLQYPVPLVEMVWWLELPDTVRPTIN